MNSRQPTPPNDPSQKRASSDRAPSNDSFLGKDVPNNTSPDGNTSPSAPSKSDSPEGVSPEGTLRDSASAHEGSLNHRPTESEASFSEADLREARLTAFALGELEGAERQEVEQWLANDEQARAEVEAIRELTGELENELAGEAPGKLTEQRRATIDAAAEKNGVAVESGAPAEDGQASESAEAILSGKSVTEDGEAEVGGLSSTPPSRSPWRLLTPLTVAASILGAVVILGDSLWNAGPATRQEEVAQLDGQDSDRGGGAAGVFADSAAEVNESSNGRKSATSESRRQRRAGNVDSLSAKELQSLAELGYVGEERSSSSELRRLEELGYPVDSPSTEYDEDDYLQELRALGYAVDEVPSEDQLGKRLRELGYLDVSEEETRPSETALSPEALSKLEALGYSDGPAQTTPSQSVGAGGSLSDQRGARGTELDQAKIEALRALGDFEEFEKANSPSESTPSPEARRQAEALGYLRRDAEAVPPSTELVGGEHSSSETAGGKLSAMPPSPDPAAAKSGSVGFFSGRGKRPEPGATPEAPSARETPGEAYTRRIKNELARDRAQEHVRDSLAHRPPSNETYGKATEQPFKSPLQDPHSTFSIDVDTAGYANVRRFLNDGQLPPADAVRIEEMINYFSYDWPWRDNGDPLSVDVEVTEAPWAPGHRLARIGIRGRPLRLEQRPRSNLVFLLDVSGSMNDPMKLPLLQSSLRLLLAELDGRDHVAIVTYAGGAGLCLDSTRCDAEGKAKIEQSLSRLRAGGSTHGSAGIRLAYETAVNHFDAEGNNRVILATDGDFNVGVTSREELETLISDSAKSGVFLSVLGFGTGNLKDGTAELLADKGNGNYSYIDSLPEAQKVLVAEMQGTLVTIAKDVKLQLEFNPAQVDAYRLIGYDNRVLAARDFNDDKKDAGEVGADHRLTVLYEIIPAGMGGVPGVDPLKYQRPAQVVRPLDSADLFNLKMRWKEPDGEVSTKREFPVLDNDRSISSADADTRFAAAVALFGMMLKNSPYAGPEPSLLQVLQLAESGKGQDPQGYRAEFLRLVGAARGLRR